MHFISFLPPIVVIYIQVVDVNRGGTTPKSMARRMDGWA